MGERDLLRPFVETLFSFPLRRHANSWRGREGELLGVLMRLMLMLMRCEVRPLCGRVSFRPSSNGRYVQLRDMQAIFRVWNLESKYVLCEMLLALCPSPLLSRACSVLRTYLSRRQELACIYLPYICMRAPHPIHVLPGEYSVPCKYTLTYK